MPGYIIVAACKDDCARKLSDKAKKFFSKMGSRTIKKLKYRQGFAFIGRLKTKNSALEKRAKHKGDGTCV